MVPPGILDAPARPGPVRRLAPARRRARIAARVLGWAVVGGLGLVAVLRVAAWDAREPLVVANALTPVLYLPAWAVLLVAAPVRRYGLALAALGVVVAQVLFLVPVLAAARPVPAWASAAPRLRLLDANVNAANPSMAGYARQIRSLHPALVTLEEAMPSQVAQLRASGALDGLPHQVEVDRFDPSAFFVASRYRLGPTRVVERDGIPLVVETVVHGPFGSLPLWVVHTVAPLPSSWRRWQAQLELVARLLERRGTRHLLVAGDFNATWQNRSFRQVLATGLTDAAAARGDPFAMTWSQSLPVLPPLVRIDHVLAGPGVAVPAIRTVAGPGSDHRAELATIAVAIGDPGAPAR